MEVEQGIRISSLLRRDSVDDDRILKVSKNMREVVVSMDPVAVGLTILLHSPNKPF